MPFRKIEAGWAKQICTSSEHNPPQHIYLEPGVYEYECPVCHQKQIVKITEPKLYGDI